MNELLQNEILQIAVPALIALACSCWIRPYILKVAIAKNIVDNPDARKLQRVPVPVLGGLTVVFGILAGVMGYNLFGDFSDLFPAFAAIVIILIVGLMDDMISLSPRVRFVAEILLVCFLITTTGSQINDFYRLWGIDTDISVPLTVFACVGIINAINLIDGVDGYSSGYTIVSCILFAMMFYALGDIRMVTLAAIVATSLLPFFIHNVFGKKSKMFIGDAGTLSLGVVFSVFVMTILTTAPEGKSIDPNLGLIPFTLAVLCVPVFDTLRVMSTRILHKRSPFSPDKTHLHHLFIELGYSHIGTTLSIIGMNTMVVICWFIAGKLGLSVEGQLYLVIALGVLITFVFYPFIKRQIDNNTALYQQLLKVGKFSHIARTGFWLHIQEWTDRKAKDSVQPTNE